MLSQMKLFEIEMEFCLKLKWNFTSVYMGPTRLTTGLNIGKGQTSASFQASYSRGEGQDFSHSGFFGSETKFQLSVYFYLNNKQ